MQALPKESILKFNENTLDDVRRAINLDKPGEMKEAVDILEEWVKQQNHFTNKEFNRHYLEFTIILCKGSVERAKQRLDKACTLKNLMADIFGDYDIRNDFTEDLKGITHTFLPNMTKDHCRIYMARNNGKKFRPSVMKSFMRTAMMAVEYIRAHDYAKGYHVIVDFMDCNLVDLSSKLTLEEVRQFAVMLIEGYGFRVNGIHILADSKLIELIVALTKQVVSPKIGDRIHVYKNMDPLIEMFGKDILPVEYGGEYEKTIEELQEEWFEVLSSKEHKDYLRVMNAARTDESLRPRDTFNEQYIGMPGTFRTLITD